MSGLTWRASRSARLRRARRQRFLGAQMGCTVVVETPHLTIDRLQDLPATQGIAVCRDSIWRLLGRAGLRLKIILFAHEQTRAAVARKRARWQTLRCRLEADSLMFVDGEDASRPGSSNSSSQRRGPATSSSSTTSPATKEDRSARQSAAPARSCGSCRLTRKTSTRSNRPSQRSSIGCAMPRSVPPKTPATTSEPSSIPSNPKSAATTSKTQDTLPSKTDTCQPLASPSRAYARPLGRPNGRRGGKLSHPACRRARRHRPDGRSAFSRCGSEGCRFRRPRTRPRRRA